MILKHNAGLVFRDPHRYRVLKAGRRFGKSRLFVAEIIRAAQKGNTSPDEYAEIWYIAPTYRQAKKIFWRVLKTHIPDHWRASKPNETDLSIMLKNGILICLKGADNPDSLRGNSLLLALFDETDYIAATVWVEVIRPMLATTGGRAIFAGTPDGRRQLQAFYERGQSTAPEDVEWGSFTFSTREGGWVSDAEIAQMRSDMDENTFLQEIMAQAVLASGQVYYALGKENILVAPKDILEGRLNVGMDFNVNPWMSACVFGMAGEKVWVIDDIIIPRGNTQMMCDEIRSRYGQRVVDVYPDPAGRSASTKAPVGTSDLTILERAGFKIHAASSTISVKNGINAVNARLKSADGQRRLFIDPSLRRKNPNRPPRMLDCLEQHIYKEGTSIPEEDEFKHLCDGLRYPINFLFPLRDKPEWGRG